MSRRIPVLLSAGAMLAFAAGGLGDIEGSKHDFTRAGWSGGDACAACHIPHADAGPRVGKWEAAARVDVKPYRGFSNTEGLPGPLSVRCLVCHDGATATDTFVDETAGLVLASRERTARMGDLSRNHPIGMRYPVRREKYQPVSWVSRNGRVRLFEDKVECTSCHDPHNQYELPYMLVMPNTRSQLCYACHKL
jgi:predicted CXXCH cytochrome family protein